MEFHFDFYKINDLLDKKKIELYEAGKFRKVSANHHITFHVLVSTLELMITISWQALEKEVLLTAVQGGYFIS